MRIYNNYYYDEVWVLMHNPDVKNINSCAMLSKYNNYHKPSNAFLQLLENRVHNSIRNRIQ